MFETVLIANRGEIAARVIRTCRALGYRSVAVYSDADADAPCVALADEAVRIGPPLAAESYLDPAKILAAAAETGAGAIHPGYGFLSENAGFAQAVIDAGLVWIGPPPEAIAAMGDKAAAKARMRAAGVPCVPGFDGSDDDEALIAAAAEIGWPLLVKAAAGGGGRGMRRVDDPGALPAALRSARAEAEAAFGSGSLLLERLVEGARHVEIQVMADAHGAVIHLGERDCSTQRRHQKVIEEAPSPAVSPALRAEMGAAACAAARAVGYVGAGTVELLLGADGAFYFLEMNTRLQVEHPVTEQVTGLDLVALQLRVAAGEPLGIAQEDVRLEGWSIEARLYAEEPARGYLPCPGPVDAWSPPTGAGVRVDHGLNPAGTISPHYDPMVAKLIASGPDRETARRRLLRALEDAVYFGAGSNRDLLWRILAHPDFAAGQITTGWLDANAALAEAPGPPEDALRALAAGAWSICRGAGDGFRIGHLRDQPLSLEISGPGLAAEPLEVVTRARSGGAEVVLAGRTYRVRLAAAEGARVRAAVDGRWRKIHLLDPTPGEPMSHAPLRLRVAGRDLQVALRDPSPDARDAASDGAIVAPMAGQVREIAVSVGQAVAAGQVVARMEAMKLETPLLAPVAGVVAEIHAAPGDAVQSGAPVVTLTPEEAP